MRYATDEEKEEMGDEEDYAIIFGDELGSYIEAPEEHIINMVYDAFYNLSQDELLQLSNRDLYNLTNDITEEAFRRAPLRKNKLYELFAKYMNLDKYEENLQQESNKVKESIDIGENKSTSDDYTYYTFNYNGQKYSFKEMFSNNKDYIIGIYPYDDAEHPWAVSDHDDTAWKIVLDGKVKDVVDTEDFEIVVQVLQRYDKNIKPRMVHEDSKAKNLIKAKVIIDKIDDLQYYDDDENEVIEHIKETAESYGLNIEEINTNYMIISGTSNDVQDYLQYELYLNLDSPEVSVL